jgi:hypothetical protein
MLGFFSAMASSVARLLVSRANVAMKIVAQEQAPAGGTDVLPAAAGMEPRDVGAAHRDEQLLDLEVIPRPRTAGFVLIRNDLPDRLRDAGAERLRHNALLHHHDGGCLVHLAEEIESVVPRLRGGGSSGGKRIAAVASVSES